MCNAVGLFILILIMEVGRCIFNVRPNGKVSGWHTLGVQRLDWGWIVHEMLFGVLIGVSNKIDSLELIDFNRLYKLSDL